MAYGSAVNKWPGFKAVWDYIWKGETKEPEELPEDDNNEVEHEIIDTESETEYDGVDVPTTG